MQQTPESKTPVCTHPGAAPIERDGQDRRLFRIGGETFTLLNRVNRDEAKILSERTGFPMVTVETPEEAEALSRKGGKIVFAKGQNHAKPLVGEGGYGKVRFAIRTTLQGTKDDIVVKKIKELSHIASSRNEALLQTKVLGKKGIMPLYGFIEGIGSKTGQPVLYVFMPLASMGDAEYLKTHLATHTEASLKTLTSLHVAKEFLLGLWHLHQVNIYHLDVKLSNLLIDSEGNIYVSDLGWSMELKKGQDKVIPQYELKADGYWHPISGGGDFSYFSPERLAASCKIPCQAFVAAMADSYAAGVSLWELFTGLSIGDDYAGQMQKHQKILRDLDEQVPTDIAHLIHGLLAVDVEERFTIAQALSHEVFKQEALHDPVSLQTAITFLKDFVKDSPLSQQRAASFMKPAHTQEEGYDHYGIKPSRDLTHYHKPHHPASVSEIPTLSSLSQATPQATTLRTPSSVNQYIKQDKKAAIEVLTTQPKTTASQAYTLNSNPPQLSQALQGWLHPFADQPDILANQALYVPLDATRDRQGQVMIDLEAQIQDYLTGDKKVLLLLADGGAGKSTFLQRLTLDQIERYRLSQSQVIHPDDNNNYNINNNNNRPNQSDNNTNLNPTASRWLPLYIPLNRLTQPKAFLEEVFRNQYGLTSEQINHIKTHHQLLFLCDGYDEMPHKVNLYLENQLSEWNIKLIITSRLNSLPQDYLTYFLPYDAQARQTPYGLLEELYLQPFSLKKIELYISHYLEVNRASLEQAVQKGQLGKGWLELATFQHYLQQMPGLMEQMKTPFLAHLTLTTLPTLVEQYTNTPQPQAIEREPSAYYFPLPQKLEAVTVNEAYLKQWYAQGALRQTYPLSESDYFAFGEALATAMLTHPQGRLAVVSFKPTWRFNPSVGAFEEASHEWSSFFSETDTKTKALRTLLPLKKLDSHTYAFIHFSLAEYLMARKLYGEIQSLPDTLPTAALLKLSLNHHTFSSDTTWYPLLRFLAQWVSRDLMYQQRLFHLVYSSKQEKGLAKATAHALMILHMAGVQFNNLDLRGISAPGADLSGIVADSTDWSGSDLSNVNLKGAWLRNGKFIDTILTGLRLYEYPHIKEEESSTASCCYSPDGKSLALATGHDIKFYEAHTRRYIKTFKGHKWFVTSIAFSPDGKILVSAGGVCDNSLKIWNVETGKCIQTLIGHTESVASVAISPDGKTVVSGSHDNSLKIWNVKTGKCIRTLKRRWDRVTSVAISPDGKTVVSGSSWDYTLKLWDVETGNCIYTLKGHTNNVYCVAISPDGKTVVSGSHDNTLKLWNMQTCVCVMTLEGHTGWVDSVCFSPDGKMVVSGSHDNTLKLWDVETGKCIQTLIGHTGGVASVAISPDGKTVVSGSADTNVKVWNTETGKCINTLMGHWNRVNSVAFSPDGKTMVSGSHDETLRLWNMETGKCIHTFARNFYSYMMSVAFSPDGTTVVSGSGYGHLKLWNVQTGLCLKNFLGHTNNVYCVAISPDGKTMVSGSEDTNVKVWNMETGKCIQTLIGHTGTVYCVAISPDGKTVVSGSFDKTLKLWNMETGKCIQTLIGHTERVYCVAISPDGKTVVSGSFDKTLKFWEVQTGKCLQTLALPYGISSLYWQGQELVVGFGHVVAYFAVNERTAALSLRWLHTQGNALMLEGADINQAQGLSIDNAELFKQRGAIGNPQVIIENNSNTSQIATSNPLTQFQVNTPESQMSSTINKFYEFNQNEPYSIFIKDAPPATTSELKREEKGLSLPNPSKLLQSTGLFKKKTHSSSSNLPTQRSHIKANLSNNYQGVAMNGTYSASRQPSERLMRPILASSFAFKALHNYFIGKKQEAQKKPNKPTGYKEKLEDFRVLLKNLKQTPSVMTIQKHLNDTPSFKHNNFFKDDRYHTLREELLTLYSPQDINSYIHYLQLVQGYYHALNNNHLEPDQAAELAVAEAILQILGKKEKTDQAEAGIHL